MGAETRTTTLRELVERIASEEAMHTIFVRRPYSETSETLIYGGLTGKGMPPMCVPGWSQPDYFMEVFVAQTFLRGCARGGIHDPRELCARLIQYKLTGA